MEIQGKLIKVLPLQTGQGRNGEWRRQDFILEQDGQYSRKVCIRTWGDKVNVESLVEGSVLNVSFDVESREFNDRWYTDLTAWKVDVVGETKPDEPTSTGVYNSGADEMSEKDDDLPF